MEEKIRKLVVIGSILVCVAIVVLAVMQIFDIWNDAGYVYIPLLGVNMLLQAYTQWKNNRSIAVFSLSTAVFIFGCAVAVYII